MEILTPSHDPALADHTSAAFSRGHAEGFASRIGVPAPRDPGISDVEWASYCEGFLTGWCER